MNFTQPNLILCTLGHVSNGKSSMIYQLSGTKTQRDSREKKRNITIKAGYANIKLWHCSNCKFNFSSNETINEYNCDSCDNLCSLDNHISFVDCPGHQELIETMMSSVSLMHGGIVIVSVVEPIKTQTQLLQHLITIKVNKLDNIIVCLNKCDLVSKEIVNERKNELDELLSKLGINPKIIIPTSFTKNLGIDYLIKAINYFFGPHFTQTTTSKPLCRITRSFDINSPGTDFTNVKGGCIGGSVISGCFEKNTFVEIRPGILTKNKNNTFSHEPIITKLLSFESDKKQLDTALPGCLIAMLTEIDPYLCKNDLLKGNIVTLVGQGLPIYHDIKVQYEIIDFIDFIWKPKKNDIIHLQINNMSSPAKIVSINDNIMNIFINKPICIDHSDNIIICIKQGILQLVATATLII